MTGPETWRRIGVRHVATEHALRGGVALLDELDPNGVPTWAWWAVPDRALVLGRGAKVGADAAACAARGVRVARRASGGGPVLWGPAMLALDVAIPRAHPRWSADVVEAYRWLGETLAATFQTLGVPAVAVDPTTARLGNDPSLAERACFAGVSPWEVMVGQRKLAGLSQIRRSPGLLLQAGLLVDPHDADLPDLLDLPGDARTALAQTLLQRTTSFAHVGLTDRDRVVAAVDAAFTATLGGGTAPVHERKVNSTGDYGAGTSMG